MKFIFIKVLGIILLLSSCMPKKKEEQQQSSSKCDLVTIQKISSTNEVELKSYFNENCTIDSIQVSFELDERSFENKNDYSLENVLASMGYMEKDSSYLIGQKSASNFYLNSQSGFVTATFPITGVTLSTINYIQVSTIGVEKEQTIVSNLYPYENSLALAKMEQTYLDHKAFLNTNVHHEVQEVKDGIIDKISLTVKAKNIDTLSYYNIAINGVPLKFRSSVKASFKDFQHENKACEFSNLLKMNKNYLKFDLAIGALDIEEIQELSVDLR